MTGTTVVREFTELSHDGWARHLGTGADPAAVLERLGERSIVGLLADAAASAGAASGAGPAQLTVDDEGVDFATLAAATGGVAAHLRASGVGVGDVVAVCGPTRLELVQAYLGVLAAGATAMLVDPRYTPHEVAHLVDTAAPVGCIADPSTPVASLVQCVAGLADAGAGADAGVVGVAELVAGSSGGALTDPGPGAPALLAFTSGTTGRPKAVPLTHRNVVSSALGVALAWRWSAADVCVHALPLFHQHGLSALHIALAFSSRLVVRSRFDPADLARTVAAHGASVLFAVPAIHDRLLASDEVAPSQLASLRLATSGSAPLPPALAARLRTELYGCVLVERYGSTEAGLDLSLPVDGSGVPGSVGFPLPGVEVALRAEAGAVGDGGDLRTGELLVRGPQVFAGYLGLGSEGFDGGYFCTGDLVTLDDAGSFTIVGRSKDIIITGGFNVAPREVEDALEAEPDVQRAAVVGVPSTRWGEAVAAAVVPAPGASPETADLLARVAQRLAPYKVPRRVLVVAELPADPLGKVRRAEVAALFPPDPAG